MAEDRGIKYSLFCDGLNEEQNKAVLSEEKRLLVLAGAGSGKTKVLIDKIIFLISEKNIDPSNILAITFSKNAKNEMLDRLILFADKEHSYSRIFYDKNLSQKAKEQCRINYIQKYHWLSNITIRTFHSLCYNLLRKYGSKEFDNRFKIVAGRGYSSDEDINCHEPEAQKHIFQKIIKETCEDSSYLIALKRYILDYYIDIPRKNAFEGAQKNYEKPYTTLRGEQVRSKSERYIADWLYIHDLDYVYEPKLEIKDFRFKPDFFVPLADLYLEHISNLSENVKEKEEQFKIAGKPLIKTYESFVIEIDKKAVSMIKLRQIIPKLKGVVSSWIGKPYRNKGI